MTLVVSVDSSTQACKVLVREVETGLPVRSGRAAYPARCRCEASLLTSVHSRDSSQTHVC
jgi:hypothetical protein